MKILTTLALALSCALSLAQSLAFRTDTEGKSVPVVAMPVMRIEAFLGKWDLDVLAFADATLSEGRIIGGGAVVYTQQIAKNMSLIVGPYAEFNADGKFRSGGVLWGVKFD